MLAEKLCVRMAWATALVSPVRQPSSSERRFERPFGGQTRRLGAQGRVLLDRDAIMQQDGGGERCASPPSPPWIRRSILPDADQMRGIMRAVIAGAACSSSRSSEILMGRMPPSEGSCAHASSMSKRRESKQSGCCPFRFDVHRRLRLRRNAARPDRISDRTALSRINTPPRPMKDRARRKPSRLAM